MPTLALYAATANISVPIILTLVVWFALPGGGHPGRRASSPTCRGWIPAGTPGILKGPIFVIEVISQFVRIISLSVRLFANILAGHMLILFMGGGLAVILGDRGARLAHPAAGNRLLPAGGGPGGHPPGLHLRNAVVHLLRRGHRRRSLISRRISVKCSTYQFPSQPSTGVTDDGLKAIALGVGAGLGSIGAGIGVGFIFGKVIESVTRQPEMREEITSIQWLGFALTEAVAFYTFIFGLIAFFL